MVSHLTMEPNGVSVFQVNKTNDSKDEGKNKTNKSNSPMKRKLDVC